MPELRETFLGEQRILEREKGSLKVEAVFHKAGEPTANGRLYSRELMAREIKKANEAIEKGEYPIGLSDHPSDGQAKTVDVSHLWESVEIDEDGICRGTIRILNTPPGRAIEEQKRQEEEIAFYSLYNEYQLSGGDLSESEFRKKIYGGE